MKEVVEFNKKSGGTRNMKGERVNLEEWANQRIEEIRKDEWRADFKAVVTCKKDIESELHNSYRDRFILSFLAQMADAHGFRQVQLVLATTVVYATLDGRYGSKAREWASTVKPFPQCPGSQRGESREREFDEFCLNVHPFIVNEAVKTFIDLEIENERQAAREEER